MKIALLSSTVINNAERVSPFFFINTVFHSAECNNIINGICTDEEVLDIYEYFTYSLAASLKCESSNDRRRIANMFACYVNQYIG